MKSSSTTFVERDAAVVVDMTSMRTSGLRIVSGRGAYGLQGAIFTKENRKITNDTPFESERIIAVEDIFSIGMMVDQHPPTYG